MRFSEWEPYYRKILEDFGYSREEDEAAARLLDSLLVGERAGDETLTRLLEGRWVTVAGNGPNLDREVPRAKGVVVAADEATSVLVGRGIEPQIVVTDLDGDVRDQVAVNARGTVAVIHAHGDNTAALREWAPRFTGPVVGTTQSTPFGEIQNFGGFTDGDRAILLAHHFGAEKIIPIGFDFDNPSPKDANRETKRRKLDWAYVLIASVLPDLFEE